MKVICYCHEQLLRSRQSWGPSINDISMEEGRVRALALGQITLLRGSKCECDKGELRGGQKFQNLRLAFLLAPMAVKQQYRNGAHTMQPHNLNLWLKLERHEMHSRMQCRILSLSPLCTCVMRRVPLDLLGCQTAKSLGH